MMEIQSKIDLYMKPNFVNFILGFILFMSFGYFSLFAKSFLPIFILIAYISYHKFNSEGKIRNISRTSLISLFIASLIAFAYFSYNTYGPKEWDFTCFYLYGNVASKGMNFYNPNDYHEILKTIEIPLTLDAEFIREVLDVGCLYPPPTLLLFSGLGFLSYTHALIIWTSMNYLFLLGSIVLISKIFFKRAGFEGMMVSTILVLIFNTTELTLLYSQILFILLFVLLLFYYYRNLPAAGFFLAIAIFLKPFTAVLFILFIIKRQTKAFFIFIVSCLSICIVTSMIYGIEPFFEYFLKNPSLRLPNFWFTEDFNQSFLAILYRKLPEHITLAKSIYYILSGIIVMMFASIMYSLKKLSKFDDIYFVILLSAALIIYPNGQSYYTLVHLISILILLRYIEKLDSSALFLFLFYLVSYSGLFYLNVFLLISSLIIIYQNKIDLVLDDIRHVVKSGT